MPIDLKELERLEQLVQRLGGDIAGAIGRGLERLEDRLDAVESRLCGRFTEIKAVIEASATAIRDAKSHSDGSVSQADSSKA